MFGIIVLFVIWLLGTVAVWALAREDNDGCAVTAVASLVLFVIMSFLSYPLTAMTGGLMPGYSTGERIGYVTKASTKGIIWKTNEVEVQVGTGEMAALQTPHPLSVPDEEIFAEVSANIGGKARIEYREWLVQPWRRGDSGYEITRVEWLDGDDGGE